LAQRNIAVGNPLRQQLVYIAVLLVALLALLFIYFTLTKPPMAKSAKQQDDFKHLFTIYGFEGDLLRRPSGVAMDDQGRIFIADTGKNRVVVFDESGNYVDQFGDPGEGQYNIKDPISIAVAPDGRIYVLSKTLKKVVVFDGSFKPVKEIKFAEWPLSLTIRERMLYVTTYRGIMVGDLDGNLITTFGKSGRAPGEFQLPGGIAIGKEGNMYVADSLNYRVQALNKDGEPIWQYGKPLPPGEAIMYKGSDRKFGLPSSIAVDDNGYLYVVDGLSSELVILDSKGKLIDRIGDVGHDDGFFYYPAGITYAGQGKVVLADKFNDRVQVFQVPLAVPASAKVFAWAPYLLLLLLPFGLWLLFRSRLQVVASEDFLKAAISGNAVAGLGQAFKNITVTQQTFESLGSEIPGNLKLTQKSVSDTAIESISSHKGLSDAQKADLALIKNSMGKKVLLANSPAVRDAADSLGLAVMSYDEFITAYDAPAAKGDE